MEKEITLVIVSTHEMSEKKEFLENVSSSVNFSTKIMYIVNKGGLGLTKIYKEALSKAETSIVVFMHDDIEFLRNGWGEEIYRLFQEHQDYGIIGVAGSAEFDSNAAWWNYKKIYGQVLHRKDGRSWLTSFSPLLKKDLEEVCVIDGLFMAVQKERISQVFDDNIDGFDFYYFDFCLSNFIDGKTKIGVTTNIRIAHNSIGELSENWFHNKEKINNKFGKKYPLSV